MDRKERPCHHGETSGSGKGCCGTASSTRQTLDEMDFERGIWTAVLNNDLDRVLKLIRAGQIDAQDNAGYTALHYAARNGQLGMCQLLLDNRANSECRTNAGQATPLQRAAIGGHRDVVSLLIGRGADLLAQDTDLRTAAHRAAEGGHEQVLADLLAADVRLKHMLDNRSRTAEQVLEAKCGRNIE